MSSHHRNCNRASENRDFSKSQRSQSSSTVQLLSIPEDENDDRSSDFQPIIKHPTKKKTNKENVNAVGKIVKKMPIFPSDITFSRNDSEDDGNQETTFSRRGAHGQSAATVPARGTSVENEIAGSSSGGGDMRLCPGCDRPVMAATFSTHSVHCLERFKFEKKSTRPDDFSAKEVCPVCRKNIRHLTTTARQVHVNRCLDSVEEEDDDELPDLDYPVAPIIVLDCPYCAHISASVAARQLHIKKCARRNGAPPEKVMKDVQLLQRQKEELREAGLFVPIARPRVAKRRRAVVKEPSTEAVSDLHMAKALSLSLFQEERKKREISESTDQSEEGFPVPPSMANGYESEDPEGELIRALGITLCPPAIKGARPRKKKTATAATNIGLLMLTAEERKEILADRVARILNPTMDDSYADRCPMLINWRKYRSGALLHGPPDRPTETTLWDLATCRRPDAVSLDDYYVPGLCGSIGPAQSGPAAGSKLRRLTQVPGYRIGRCSTPTLPETEQRGEKGGSPVSTQALIELLDVDAFGECCDINETLGENEFCGDGGFISQMIVQSHSPIDFDVAGDDDDFTVAVLTPLEPDRTDDDHFSTVGSHVHNSEAILPAPIPQPRSCYPNDIVSQTTPPLGSLVEKLLTMVGESAKSDSSIVTKDGEFIPCHQQLLYATCRPLYDDLERCRNWVLEWRDVSKAATLAFLQFAYSGTIIGSYPTEELLPLAKRYQLSDLTRLVSGSRSQQPLGEVAPPSSTSSSDICDASGHGGQLLSRQDYKSKNEKLEVRRENVELGSNSHGVTTLENSVHPTGATQSQRTITPKKKEPTNKSSSFASLCSKVATLAATFPSSAATLSSPHRHISQEVSCSTPAVHFDDLHLASFSPDLFGDDRASTADNVGFPKPSRSNCVDSSVATSDFVKSIKPKKVTSIKSTNDKTTLQPSLIKNDPRKQTSSVSPDSHRMAAGQSTVLPTKIKLGTGDSVDREQSVSPKKLASRDESSRTARKKVRNFSKHQSDAHSSKLTSPVSPDPRKKLASEPTNIKYGTDDIMDREQSVRPKKPTGRGDSSRCLHPPDEESGRKRTTRTAAQELSGPAALATTSRECKVSVTGTSFQWSTTNDNSSADSSIEYVPSRITPTKNTLPDSGQLVCAGNSRSTTSGRNESATALYFPEYVPTKTTSASDSPIDHPIYVPSPKKSPTGHVASRSTSSLSSSSRSTDDSTRKKQTLHSEYVPSRKATSAVHISDRSRHPSRSSKTENRSPVMVLSPLKTSSRSYPSKRDAAERHKAGCGDSLLDSFTADAAVGSSSVKAPRHPVQSSSSGETFPTRSSRPTRVLLFKDDDDGNDLVSSLHIPDSDHLDGSLGSGGRYPRMPDWNENVTTGETSDAVGGYDPTAALFNTKKRKHGGAEEVLAASFSVARPNHKGNTSDPSHRSDCEKAGRGTAHNSRHLSSPEVDDRVDSFDQDSVWNNFDDGGYDDYGQWDASLHQVDEEDSDANQNGVPAYVPEITSTPKSSLSLSRRAGVGAPLISRQPVDQASDFLMNDSLPDLAPVPVYSPTKIGNQLTDETNTQDYKIKKRTNDKKNTASKRSKKLPNAKAVTPMLHYSMMPTPEVTNHLKKIGVRKLAKKAGVKVLKHVYKETHPEPQEIEDSYDISRSPSPPNPTQELRQLDPPAMQTTSKRQEKGVVEKLSGKQVNGEVDPNVMQRMIKDYIASNHQLHTNVLEYKPIDIAEIHNHLKSRGIKCKVEAVKDIFDEECVAFTSQDDSPRKKKSKRRK